MGNEEFTLAIGKFPIEGTKATGDSWVQGGHEIVETASGYRAIDLETGAVFPAEMGQTPGLRKGKVIFVSEME